MLEKFLECGQVLVHPALVQPDGFQSFLHASHLGATLLQPGEETLHLDDTQIHTGVFSRLDQTHYKHTTITASHLKTFEKTMFF